MKKLILSIFLVLLSLNIAMAQAPKEANPADVSSLDAIMKAVYDVISGDAGKPRDWDRFRSLFYQGARLIPTNKNADTGAIGAKTLSPDDYVARVEPFFAKEGFYESELSRQVDQYGHIAHVFSTYESKHARADAKPFARGTQITKNKDGTPKENETVVAWVNDYHGTRVFSTTIGHNNATVEDARYLDLVTRGLLWACGKLDDKGKIKSGYGPKN